MEFRFEKTSSAVAAWWQRRSRGVLLPAPDPSDVGERKQPDDWPPSLPFRIRPKPYSRAIAWAPFDGRRTQVQDRSQPFELFVVQAVLRDVRSHLIGSANDEPYGFLLGHVVYCPWTRAPYVVIDTVRRETREAPHSGELDAFRRSWASASREARRRRGQIIGWYHQHGVLGLRLSQSDFQLQEEFFPEAWHCVLLIVPGPEGVVGGFVQRTGRASLYRKGISGFYELVDLDAKLIDGKKPSVVDWTNYEAGERVEVLRARWPASRTRARPASAGEGRKPQPEVDEDGETPTASGARAGLAARRWRKRTSSADKEPAAGKKPASKAEPAAKTGPPPDEQATPATADLSEEFHEAVGQTELEPDDAPASAAPASGAPARSPLDVDEGQVAEFLEAVWGPAPFESEESEGPVMDLPPHLELPPADGPEMRPTLELPDTPTPLTAPDGAFGAEPPEMDSSAGSLEWLLGLVEETLSAGRSTAQPGPDEAEEQAAEEQAAEQAEEQPAKQTAEAATGDAEPRADAAESPEAVRPTVEPEGPAPGGDTSRLARPPRFTYVGTTEDPDEDREAEIPVVMPTEDGLGRFRLPRRKRDRALIAAAMAIAAASAWFVLGREEPARAAFQTAAPIAQPTAQAPQFVRLSGEFTAALAAYGERGADFLLGRIDCAGLTTGYEALAAAFSALSEYVALAPSGSVNFRPLADEMREARTQFEASGCAGSQGGTEGPGP